MVFYKEFKLTLPRPPPLVKVCSKRRGLLSSRGGCAPRLALTYPEYSRQVLWHATNHLILNGVLIMATKDRESSLRGRDAKTGEFIPVSEARQRPNTTVVERVPLPGKGKK